MTEQEAMEILKKPCLCDYDLSKTVLDCDIKQCDKRDAVLQAIKALEEVQTYRAIGTPEECRAAMDRQTEKKPYMQNERNGDECMECPSCDCYIGYKVDLQDGHQPNYCQYCGQLFNWEDMKYEAD